MISYIKGTLEYIDETWIVIETAGIGYRVFVSPKTISSLPPIQNNIKIYTYMNVKDDGINLYGFLKQEDLELFNKLLLVSGIGPKGALNILGSMSSGEIILSIVSEDIKALSKAPGVGKKTAQRLIIELKDKFKNSDFLNSLDENTETEFDSSLKNEKSEALEALLALGYSRTEAVTALKGISFEGMDTGAILKTALKKIIK